MFHFARNLGLLVALYRGGMMFTQGPTLTLDVIDINKKTLPNVKIKCSEGCPMTTSDRNGTAVLKLVPENVKTGLVTLRIVSAKLALVSPWDGTWPIAKLSLKLVLERKGDKLALNDARAIEAITASQSCPTCKPLKAVGL